MQNVKLHSLSLSQVKWEVTEKQKTECQNKGKDPEVSLSSDTNLKRLYLRRHCVCALLSQLDCKNYIRILHKMDDDRMYVCGTNAFDPECDYMVRHNKRFNLFCINHSYVYLIVGCLCL